MRSAASRPWAYGSEGRVPCSWGLCRGLGAIQAKSISAQLVLQLVAEEPVPPE
jgi:hypothetical protein